VYYGCCFQAKIDADDVARSLDRPRQDDLPFALNRERDEPPISATADCRRDDAPVEAAGAARLFQPHLSNHRQANVTLA
jgi:hypothetical protein